MKKKTAGGIGLILAATLLAYAPLWRAGFVWNDPDYVTRPALQSLGGLRKIWFQVGATEQYYPLLHSFFWVEHRLWGRHALGYHLADVLLHALAAILFAQVLRRLWSGQRDGTAWFAALVFALHPVCAESAAWISEQKNTLSLVFYLLATLGYLRFDATRRPRAYIWSLIWFLAALLSKTVTATLPGALLVALWWRKGSLERRRDVAPLLPWFALAAAVGVFSAYVEHHYVGARGADFALSGTQRLLLAGRMPWFYLLKLLWPAHLVFIYPRWTLDTTQAETWFGLAATLGALVAAWAWRRRNRGPLAVALFFLGSLVPTLGFLNVYGFIYSYVADHWDYLPSLGIIAGAAALLASAARPWTAATRVGAASALLAGLGALTWRQCLAYRNPETFYRTIIARNPAAWMAESNLGDLLTRAGRLDEAMAHYRAALAIRSDLEIVHFDLGSTLSDAGRYSDAAAEYRAALKLKPDFAAADNNLGAALEQLGRYDEATAAYEAALAIQPLYAAPRRNLDRAAGRKFEAGVEAARSGGLEISVLDFQAAIRFRPDFPEAENDLGAALARLGRPAEAVPHYRAALRLRPGYADARSNLALALRALGRGGSGQN